jgi:hypothetical protein
LDCVLGGTMIARSMYSQIPLAHSLIDSIHLKNDKTYEVEIVHSGSGNNAQQDAIFWICIFKGQFFF